MATNADNDLQGASVEELREQFEAGEFPTYEIAVDVPVPDEVVKLAADRVEHASDDISIEQFIYEHVDVTPRYVIEQNWLKDPDE